MIKKISIFLIAFIFGFLCFFQNVKATDIYSEYFNIYDFLSNEQLEKINESILEFKNNNNYTFNACHVVETDKLNTNSFRLQCGYADTFKFNDNGSYFILSIDKTSNIFFYINTDDYSISNINQNSNSGLWLLFTTLNYGTLFWTDDSYFTSSGNVTISDEVYSSITDNYKKYYNYQNYLVTDSPLYSIINLRLGNWKGYTGNVTINYCFDNNCNSNVSEVINYKYGISGEDINLLSYLPETKNDYKLDSSESYVIKSGSDISINVYYYSVGIPYTIKYYFDDELQEDLTEKLSGVTGDVITLYDLDEVKENIYFLDISKDYTLSLKEGESNIINVYYYSKDINYNVNIYLDDIYYQSHSFVGIGKLGGEVILEDLEETINVYTLDEREYKLSLTENSSLNYINVYYYSENYNTEYQDIDTTGKFYIPFSWVRIKEIFNLNGLYTQTQQFVIVYAVNILFYVVVVLVAYFGLKMINKLFSLIKMF